MPTLTRDHEPFILYTDPLGHYHRIPVARDQIHNINDIVPADAIYVELITSTTVTKIVVQPQLKEAV